MAPLRPPLFSTSVIRLIRRRAAVGAGRRRIGQLAVLIDVDVAVEDRER